MKRPNVIAVFVVTLLIVIFVLINSGVKARTVRLNKRDLPEYGLLIVAPTDPSFNSEVVKLSAGRSNEQKRLIEITKPFSVFVRNSGSQDVIAYRLRWDAMQPDGTVTTHIRSYAEPDVLMGGVARSISEVTRNAGVSIRSNSSRYVSLTSSIGQSEEVGIMSSMGSDASNVDAGQIQQIGAEENEAALLDLLGTELARAESLTVTLDVAIFDDGSFIGPDSLNYIEAIEAQVAAKRQLLDGVLRAAWQKSPDHVFDDLESIANQPDTLIDANSRSADYYRIYEKEFAKELLRTRAASADDKQTIWYATRRLFRRWPQLHRKR